MTKAVFLDRDGVINPLLYHQELGIIDSPFTVEQFELLPGVGQAITKFHEMGFKVILISNQPAIAKGHLSMQTFQEIKKQMQKKLAEAGAWLDEEYYCFHHPEAKVKIYQKNCSCRKPKPGLLLKAASELNISLSDTWMIGDGITDVKAGKDAGCKTILLGRMQCSLCRLMEEQEARPDAIVPNLMEAAETILKWEGENADFPRLSRCSRD